MRIVLVVAAIGLQAGALYAVYAREQWLATAGSATGVVVEHRSHRGEKGRTTWSEVVRFTTPDGKTVEFEESLSTSHPYERGKTVPVRFQPTDPTDAAIDSTFRHWLLPGILAAVGVAFELSALCLVRGPVPTPPDPEDA